MKEHASAATDAGLFMIVDYHVIGFPDGYYQRVLPEWRDPPNLYDSDFALATDFWDAVSALIQDPRVMFELWNEPVYEEDELHPSVSNGSKWVQLKPYYEALISTIRDNGGQSVILATGNYWAYNLKGIKDVPLSDPNTAYTWHVYAGHDENNPNRWAAALDGCTRSSRFSLPSGASNLKRKSITGHRTDVREQVPGPVPGRQRYAQHRLVLEQELRTFDGQRQLADPHRVG